MSSNLKPPLREIWFVCLLLGLGLFNYPFVEIFNKDRLFLGWPLLSLYFFACWGLLILIIYLFSVRFQHRSRRGPSPEREEAGPE